MKGFVEVELVEEWLGHPAGSILQMRDFFAQALIGRGGAKAMAGSTEAQSGAGQKVAESEEDGQATQTARVKMQRRVLDKMVKGSIDK